MIKSKSGFTIVELLIVIVIIAILAAITIIAYNGIQKRALNSSRLSDANAIMKALELYRAKNGSYPPTTATVAATCTEHTNGYSYSDATDGNWLKTLVSDGVLSKVPTPTPNNCDSFYSYLKPDPAAYDCSARTQEYYVLTIYGIDNSQPLPVGANSSMWYPCTGAKAGWGSGGKRWTFVKEA